ncbi:MAG: hypothetical protein O3A47_13450 [Chloroflexi bacterium]|nr:hypothetical protein [Chloroflexota bacterium]
MAKLYEADISAAALEMFQSALLRYMASLDFDHLSIGGRLGRRSVHEFKRGEEIVSLTSSHFGESEVRIAVHSQTVDVEKLVLDVLTEGVADFMEPFCKGITDRNAGRVLDSLIVDLRDAFEKVSQITDEAPWP